MGRQLWIADALRLWGLAPIEEAGWKTRGSATFDPVGVLCHHTAGAATGDYPSLRVVRDGRPDLPGPLSQIGLGRKTIRVIAAGKANHAGKGYWRGETAGGTRFFGIEAESVGDGKDWTVFQRTTYPIVVAALLHHVGSGAEWCAAHREYALPKGRKPDPVGIDMDDMRRDVAALLAAGPPGTQPPPPEEDDDMKPFLAQAEGTPVFLIFPNGQAEAGVPTEAALADAKRIYGDTIEKVSRDFLRLHGVPV